MSLDGKLQYVTTFSISSMCFLALAIFWLPCSIALAFFFSSFFKAARSRSKLAITSFVVVISVSAYQRIRTFTMSATRVSSICGIPVFLFKLALRKVQNATTGFLVFSVCSNKNLAIPEMVKVHLPSK